MYRDITRHTDASFDELQIQDGNIVVGYRVTYVLKDPYTGNIFYQDPTIEGVAEILDGNIAVHNPKQSDRGFRYFESKDVAEAFLEMLKMIAPEGKPVIQRVSGVATEDGGMRDMHIDETINTQGQGNIKDRDLKEKTTV